MVFAPVPGSVMVLATKVMVGLLAAVANSVAPTAPLPICSTSALFITSKNRSVPLIEPVSARSGIHHQRHAAA